MTGPEHYAEAQSLLIAADDGAADWEPLVARAQAHATLALAAATAMNDADGGLRPSDWNEWVATCGADTSAGVS